MRLRLTRIEDGAVVFAGEVDATVGPPVTGVPCVAETWEQQGTAYHRTITLDLVPPEAAP